MSESNAPRVGRRATGAHRPALGARDPGDLRAHLHRRRDRAPRGRRSARGRRPRLDDSAARRARPAAASDVEVVDGTVSVGDSILRLPAHAAAAYDGTKPVPLVILLHGTSGTIDWIEDYTGMVPAAGQRGYAVLTPQGSAPRTARCRRTGPSRRFDPPGAADDVAFVERARRHRDPRLLHRREPRVRDRHLRWRGVRDGAGLQDRPARRASRRWRGSTSCRRARTRAADRPRDPRHRRRARGLRRRRASSVDARRRRRHGADGRRRTADPGTSGRPTPRARRRRSTTVRCRPTSRAGLRRSAAASASGASAPSRRRDRDLHRVPCRESTVALWTVQGGGHTWPGGSTVPDGVGVQTDAVTATQAILDAFDTTPSSGDAGAALRVTARPRSLRAGRRRPQRGRSSWVVDVARPRPGIDDLDHVQPVEQLARGAAVDVDPGDAAAQRGDAVGREQRLAPAGRVHEHRRVGAVRRRRAPRRGRAAPERDRPDRRRGRAPPRPRRARDPRPPRRRVRRTPAAPASRAPRAAAGARPGRRARPRRRRPGAPPSARRRAEGGRRPRRRACRSRSGETVRRPARRRPRAGGVHSWSRRYRARRGVRAGL